MMNRRKAIKICGCASAMFVFDQMLKLNYTESILFSETPKLVIHDANGNPFKASSLEIGQELIFFYPNQGTPCYLINLGSEAPAKSIKLSDDTSYHWNGGVGKNNSIVAFTAICAHKQTYPKKSKSMVYYDHENQSIRCCAHAGEFTLIDGGIPTASSPTESSLASVLLDWNSDTDELSINGMIGPSFYKRFFKRHKLSLRRQYGSSAKAKDLVTDIKVMPLNGYSKKVVTCKMDKKSAES